MSATSSEATLEQIAESDTSSWGSWLVNGALSGVTLTLSSAMTTSQDLASQIGQDRGSWATDRLFRSSSAESLTFQDWSGCWECCDASYSSFLEAVGSQPAQASSYELHEYLVDKYTFNMQHKVPASIFQPGRDDYLTLSFKAQLDGELYTSPYPHDDMLESHKPEWRNHWEEEPTCFISEFSNYLGKEGLSVSIMRHLTSRSNITITTTVLQAGELRARTRMTLRKLHAAEPVFAGAMPEEPVPAQSEDPAHAVSAQSEFLGSLSSPLVASVDGAEASGSAESQSADDVVHVAMCGEDPSASGSADSSSVVSLAPVSSSGEELPSASSEAPANKLGCRMSTASTDVSSGSSLAEEEEVAVRTNARRRRSFLESAPFEHGIEAWEWPMSRGEKKLLLHMYDRKLLEQEVAEHQLQAFEIAHERDTFAQRCDELMQENSELKAVQS